MRVSGSNMILDAGFWRDRRVLVGGGCGFLGTYIVPLLVEAGAQVVVADLEPPEAESLLARAGAVRFVRADLRERTACTDLLRGQDMHINLAARASGVGFSRAHHGLMLVDNLLCTLTPLDVARELAVPRVAIVSSSCVYDDASPVPTPELDPFVGEPEHVNEGYGWAKRIQELAGRYYARETGVGITVLRPFNMYGANYPWRSLEKAHVIPSLVKRVLDGEDPLVVWGSGEQRRNFLHGSDAAAVMLKVIERGAGGPVNIGYEDDTRIADLVALVCEVTGRRPRIVFDTSKPDGQARKSADATRLRALTGGYEPRVSLRDGIAEMVRWYDRQFRQAI